MARKTDPNNMSFLDHLEELRWHLIRATLGIVLGAVIAFVFKDFFIGTLLMGPKHLDFPTYQWLCDLGTSIGMGSGTCIEELPFTIENRQAPGQFTAFIWLSLTFGFIMAFPWVIYQFWSFVSPGLKRSERRSSRAVIVFCSILFFMGVLFGYYIITPLSINFFANFQLSEEISNMWDVDSYVGLVRSCVLACGIMFELPIVIFFLAKAGLVTADFLRRNRKYALVLILILAAFITPPDVISQVIVAVPVLLLYEMSIWIAVWIERRARKREKRRLAGAVKSN